MSILAWILSNIESIWSRGCGSVTIHKESDPGKVYVIRANKDRNTVKIKRKLCWCFKWSDKNFDKKFSQFLFFMLHLASKRFIMKRAHPICAIIFLTNQLQCSIDFYLFFFLDFFSSLIQAVANTAGNAIVGGMEIAAEVSLPKILLLLNFLGQYIFLAN